MSTTFKTIDDNKFSIQFTTLQYTSASYIYSQKAEFGGLNWSLVTCTAYDADKKQNLAIYLHCYGNKSNLWNADINANLMLRKANGMIGETKAFNYKYTSTGSWGYQKFIDIPLLANQGYIKDGCITIECIVTIKSAVGVQPKKIHNFEVKDPVLSDVALIVEGKKLYANKAILSINSSELRTHLFPKNNKNKIDSLGFTDRYKYNEFEQFLQCLYSPQNVDKNNVESVLKIADRFAVHALMDKCENFLISSDDINKSIKLNYAETYKLSNLQAAVLDSIKENTELKSMTSDTENLGDATIRALFKKLGDITI